ncbi:HK97 gp10 family phage protein [Desulfosporosinus sp. Sb-LF]|uniref:HK97 gp10 family phage protein n=1 Tax=Desulfosporosinus sp. Sb-LF TaxID=2560027 RepID=UPI00107FBC91|nr:HK97 gp10 family phage protein [Desulfosporosinus sp. Sb-LF]TGE33327.1 hypothetical protein E4K68_07485 [Desulfosporosinus sp. Sb-LF]
MADDFTIAFDGISEFQAKLEAVRAQYPYKEEEILLKLGKTLKASAKSKTPTGVSKKHVKNQYKLSKVNYLKDGTNITMTNTSPLFHLLEKGHVIRNEKNGQALGFVPGKHMVEIAMLELEQTLPATVEDWLDGVLGGAS